MKRKLTVAAGLLAVLLIGACSTYEVKPLPFRTPDQYANVQHEAGAAVAAEAYNDREAAEEAFGFDVHGVGLMPIQVVIENRGEHPLSIRGGQTFLEDAEGNLWSLLPRELAYERVTKYSQTKDVLSEGGYMGLLGAGAGALVGAAVGIITGENVAVAAGKGAALGGAGGAVIGGAKGYSENESRRRIISDLKRKSLENQPVQPGDLGYGFLFFPVEAQNARSLRLQLLDEETRKVHVLNFDFTE